MSFLEQLLNKKNSLKSTDTVVTLADGKRFVESRGNNKEIEGSCGFVIDTKPDNFPAKITENIYLGSQDCCDLEVLQEHNLSYVLSIGIEAPCKYPHITYKFVKCLDFPEVNIIPVVESECIPFIIEAINNRQNILVHCNAGVSRSSSVVLAYLILVKGLPYQDAYDLVKSKRQCIKPNAGFEKQLKSLQKT